MESDLEMGIGKPQGSTDKSLETLRLELEVQEPTVIKYLESFDKDLREAKALEALRVGVIAIQSASPTLDTKVVEEKFRQVERSINNCITAFQDDTKRKLEEYFKADSGSLPRSLETLFGKSGTVTNLLNQYFGADSGKVSRLLQEQVGPSSEFAKSLDPKNKESVISRIEDLVKNQLQEKSQNIVNEFSLDKKDSALSRLNVKIEEKIQEIRTTNSTFFSDLKQALGVETGKQLEAEKGTDKGRKFETALYDRLAEMGRLLTDSTNNVAGVVGALPRSKKGDYVIVLGETSGVPGGRIIVEAKNEHSYKLQDAIDELKEAKENREASAGIFAFAKGCEPSEVGDFLRVGQDFYITVDEQAVERNQPLVFLEAAYKISRVLLVNAARKEEAREIDTDRIRGEIDSIMELVGRLSDLSTKAKTIYNHSKIIDDVLTELKESMEARLKGVLQLLS